MSTNDANVDPKYLNPAFLPPPPRRGIRKIAVNTKYLIQL